MSQSIVGGPEIQLWASVLKQAIRDLVSLERSGKDRSNRDDHIYRQDYRSLLRWFNSKSLDVGAFHWICLVLDLEPGYALPMIMKHCEERSSSKNGRGFRKLRKKSRRQPVESQVL